MPTNLPELLTGPQARELAGLTVTAWLELLETQRLPRPVNVSGRLQWRRADIMRWAAELETTEVFSA